MVASTEKPLAVFGKSATSSKASSPVRERLVERHPDRRGLRIGVRRPRQRAVVGLDVLAEGHPDRQLALVVRLVGVQLRPGRVADDPEAVGDPQAAVARVGRPPGRVDAVVLETEIVDRERAPHGQQHRMAGRRGPVVELDDVRPARRGRRRAPAAPGRRAGPSRRPARAPGGPPRSCADDRSARAAGRTGRSSSARRTGRTPGRARSPSARRPGPAGSRAASGRGSPRGSSRAGPCSMPSIGAAFEIEPTATTTFAAADLVGDPVMGDRHAPRSGDPGRRRDRPPRRRPRAPSRARGRRARPRPAARLIM